MQFTYFTPNELNNAREFLDETKARHRALRDRVNEHTEELNHWSRRLEGAKKARVIIQRVSQETQKNLEFHLSHLVTTALASVFPEQIEFVARIEVRRGQTECDLLFKEYGQEYDPLEGSGFGPVDVASFALRITFWSLNKNRPTFVLDEPFRNVSPDLQHKVSDMLKMVSEKLGVQIVMISHQEDINISADKTFLAKKEGKITLLEEL
jgi:DNA repair exonuclease SbcCD ATPase subunit